MTKQDRGRLLTTIEVGKMLGVDPSTVRRMIHSGSLQAVKLQSSGAKVRYKVYEKTIEELLEPKYYGKEE